MAAAGDGGEHGPEPAASGATSMLEAFAQLGFAPTPDAAPAKPPLFDSFDVQGVADYVLAHGCENVVVMSGAGISTSAGIPDFRTKGTGLYDNLQKYDLPHPQAIFEIGFFREKPEPFFLLAKELYPGNFEPTPSHHFVRLLQDKGLLLRHYTQNIDTLERQAGINPSLLVEAHGSFAEAHCIDCKAGYEQDWVRGEIFAEKVPTCIKCGGLVKPDIVFFGEELPERFTSLLKEDFKKCDLLLVMGTSLQVQPFASLVDMPAPDCPRVLINREVVGVVDPMLRALGFGEGLDFDSEHRDVALLGTCDEQCAALADALGWASDFSSLTAASAAKQPAVD